MIGGVGILVSVVGAARFLESATVAATARLCQVTVHRLGSGSFFGRNVSARREFMVAEKCA